MDVGAELDALDAGLSALAAEEGITLPAAAPAPDQLVVQLLAQQSKLLELVAVMAQTAQRHAEAAAHTAPAAAPPPHHAAPPDDAALLKRRWCKVQRALLSHLADARAQLAAADSAREAACRREARALSAAAALRARLLEQEQELVAVREQLQEVAQLHSSKLARAKQRLQQRYEAQLAATTAAYAEELAAIQPRTRACGRGGGGAEAPRVPQQPGAPAAGARQAGAGAQEHCDEAPWQRPRGRHQCGEGGGEGTTRPLTAPSSDRRAGASPPRSARVSAAGGALSAAGGLGGLRAS
ncbi:hypothetical protein HT031_004962 [Scenedesmus sp. PABB004]|nr:hypothetical protein HT031_004962 [Scenedesmus sp. PABB004]